jgi:hypothetical protein
MNARPATFSGRVGYRAAVAVGAMALVAALTSPAALAQSPSSGAAPPYPTFAEVPPAPTDVRSLDAWRASVMAIRGAGTDLTTAVAQEPWTLNDTEGWVARARAEDTPPPPITTPSEDDTAAFAAAMRERATPPPRHK